jgi:hypothetical protein
MRESDKYAENKRVDGATTDADNVRGRDGLPVPRGCRMNRTQPKAGRQIEDAFSYSLGPRDRGGKAATLSDTQGRDDRPVKAHGKLEAMGAEVRSG